MSQFKNNPNFNLFYNDTDSAYTDKPLLNHLINYQMLSKINLENVLNKTIFLTPKIYF
jgi:hypothetical protein